jgi:hypothetical protein
MIAITQRRMTKDALERFGVKKVSTTTVTPLYPGQPVYFHPHAKAIEKLNSPLANAALPLEERKPIEAKIAALHRYGDPFPPKVTTRYMQIVGALQYLATVSGPDIAYAAGNLARSMSKASTYLLKYAERLQRYPFSTMNYSLVLDGSKDCLFQLLLDMLIPFS